MVAALDTNSDNYIAGYYAAAKAGLTWLPLNYRAKDAELEYMINTAGAKVLLVGDRYLDLVGARRVQAQDRQSGGAGAKASRGFPGSRTWSRRPRSMRAKSRSRTRTSRS